MDLTLVCTVYVAIVHCSLLTLNMQSVQYLRLSGIISNHKNLSVVVFSVSAACASLIPHHSPKSSGVVFKCRSSDKNLVVI